MSLDLTLLVAVGQSPSRFTYAHSMVEVFVVGELSDELFAIEKRIGRDVPVDFNSYTSREDGKDAHYGRTRETPYGERTAEMGRGAGSGWTQNASRRAGSTSQPGGLVVPGSASAEDACCALLALIPLNPTKAPDMATAAAPRAPRKTDSGIGLRFTISREQLMEGLAAVVPSTPGKSTLPILSNLLIESSNRGIKLSGTDLDISVSHEIAADVERDGKMTVPAKRLLSIAKELAPAPVRFSLGASDVVTIDCGRSHYSLRTLPDHEFPLLPPVEFGTSESWSIRAGDLQSMAKRTAFACSTAESRPIMSGVLIELSGGAIRFVASDGARLARVEQEIVGYHHSGQQVIVPPKALDFIARLFAEEDEVDVARTDNHLSFRTTSTQITTRLIEGPYPPYDRVVPKKHTRTVRFDRVSLISVIKRMVPIASTTTHRLAMTLSAGKITIQAQTPDIGEGYDELPATLEGDAVTIGVNASFFLEALAALTGEEVVMWSGAPDKALLLKPFTAEDKVTALYLLMPTRVLD